MFNSLKVDKELDFESELGFGGGLGGSFFQCFSAPLDPECDVKFSALDDLEPLEFDGNIGGVDGGVDVLDPDFEVPLSTTTALVPFKLRSSLNPACLCPVEMASSDKAKLAILSLTLKTFGIPVGAVSSLLEFAEGSNCAIRSRTDDISTAYGSVCRR